jgi:hypothetical protein
MIGKENFVFSSPELKAQVSYSHCLLSVVCLSVCKLLYFQLLLQNHWANFIQTWHKSSLGGGIKVYSNEGQHPSLRGDNRERKNLSSQEPVGQFQSNLVIFG